VAQLLIAAIVLSAPSAWAQDLVRNGTFESFNYDGWEEVWNFGAGGSTGDHDGSSLNNWGFETEIPFQGAASAKNFWDGGIYQDVPVVGGQTYTLGFSMYVPDNAVFAPYGTFIQVEWLDADGNDPGFFPDSFDWLFDGAVQMDWDWNEWNSHQMVVTAPLNHQYPIATARISFGTWAGSGVVPDRPTRFDNISFHIGAIPEPDPQLALALGLGAIFLLRLFKRQPAGR
jgi:hypothetical protein